MMIKTNQQPWVWAHQAEEYAAAVHQVRLLVSSTAVVAREHAEFSPAPTLAKTGSASPMTLLMRWRLVVVKRRKGLEEKGGWGLMVVLVVDSSDMVVVWLQYQIERGWERNGGVDDGGGCGAGLTGYVAVIMVAVVSNHLDRYSNSHLSSLNPTVVLEDVAVDGNRDTNSSSE
ncbi:hypothetical protein R6Q59_016614 [Mikania micrantha]